MSQSTSPRAPKILADETDEPQEQFEYDGEIPSLDELEVEDVESGEVLPVYGDDDEL
jgi:hypothetical protein